jgi:hypothetical protein
MMRALVSVHKVGGNLAFFPSPPAEEGGEIDRKGD